MSHKADEHIEPTPQTPEEPQRQSDDASGPLGVYCYLLIMVIILGVALLGFQALLGRGSWLRFLAALILGLLASLGLDRLARWKR